ncbi:cryptococcal mannosyltransferase 1-domain-containing protein [Echria macrotheca]|uniref:Cryptococcal mannosyltransferase 1-domain-containing protein n=1 Tax=Echria macrotheca TaxID=438768 RepID=A0AAJ0B5P6_9PEZI|nr:cryptococcal mannosyltransferase 1-domain-containing protein [Echria macrotheca]
MALMTRRKAVLLAQLAALFVVVLFLTSHFGVLPDLPVSFSAPSAPPKAHHIGFSVDDHDGTTRADDGDDWVSPIEVERFTNVSSLLPSILDPADTSIDRMTCPPLNATRYGYLRPTTGGPNTSGRPYQYVFVLNLRQTVGLLPRLLGSVVEAIRFLGPAHCALSIVEGNSDDGTLEVLRLLAEPLAAMGVPYWLITSPLKPAAGDRITKLALLRALAVEPVTGPLPAALRDATTLDADGKPEVPAPNTYWALPRAAANLTSLVGKLSPDATVIFANDVAACAEDLLELVHQRLAQGADMTCAMDWAHGDGDDVDFFYDVWIGRGIDGDLFFEIDPLTLLWAGATHLFPHEHVARARLAAGVPFQVFACWNGAVAFAAAPLEQGRVGFRWPKQDECYQGEVQLFCKDMWAAGSGKIAVVPSVNLQYTDADGRHIKKARGYVSDFALVGVDVGEQIGWRGPPEQVKCMPTFSNQKWLPWNESLV